MVKYHHPWRLGGDDNSTNNGCGVGYGDDGIAQPFSFGCVASFLVVGVNGDDKRGQLY